MCLRFRPGRGVVNQGAWPIECAAISLGWRNDPSKGISIRLDRQRIGEKKLSVVDTDAGETDGGMESPGDFSNGSEEPFIAKIHANGQRVRVDGVRAWIDIRGE